MNYGQVKSQFQGLLNRRDITPSQVETFVQQAISRCQRQLRIPAMEKALVATIGSTYNGLTVPHDFLELIRLVASDGRELTRTNVTLARASQDASLGTPRIFARQGSKWFLGPKPAEADTVRIDYYAEFEALANDAATNVLTSVAADLIVYGALSYACDWFMDDRAPTFEGRYQQILSELHAQAAADELSGGAVIAPALSYPDE